jgi:Zn-dependent M28 family amino/carboxypeptidase
MPTSPQSPADRWLASGKVLIGAVLAVAFAPPGHAQTKAQARAETSPAETSPAQASPAATQWWADISAIAADSNEGRQTGSAGYLRAVDYVMARFRAEGLTPAGVDGYLQPVAFEQQVVDQAASQAALVGADGTRTVLQVGTDALISAGGARRPARIDAPLVFIGYGLHLPKQGHDDFAGLDLRGKIAVVISGGPADIAAAVKSNARFERTKLLGKMGAVGLIALTTPHQIEIPWARQKLLAGQKGMYLADASLRDTPDDFFAAGIDPDKAALLFQDSGHTFAELCALADASRRVPTFALPLHLQASVAARHETLTSPNLVARLAGSDPALAGQYLVISAHLDHLGIGAPINGHAIYNGAMDDASGVAAALDIAHRLASAPTRPRRSILFVIVTAEEKGLLGSHYYAMRPTVPAGSIVADFNFDMPLPLWPLQSVLALGEGESTLGADAQAVAAQQGLALAPDPLPDRNTFIRTDLFSFVREGVPALAFKFGFARNTPQARIEHDWRANRYHSPADDLQQPGVFKEEAVKLDAFVAALALRVADADTRPEWLSTSIFKR